MIILQVCSVDKLRQTPNNSYHYGYDAYDMFIKDIGNGDRQCMGECGYYIRSLMDARRAAYIYLVKSKTLLENDNQKKLKNFVSVLYKAVDLEKEARILVDDILKKWE